MTIPARHVASLRELVAEWDTADTPEEQGVVGARLVGLVQHLLAEHDEQEGWK